MSQFVVAEANNNAPALGSVDSDGGTGVEDNDSEGEAAETQTWIEFAVRCGYMETETGRDLFKKYEEIISMLVAMVNNADSWVLPSKK